MARKKKKIGPPRRLHTLFDIAKAGRDAAVSTILSPIKYLSAPKADGHPVLLLPGFMTHDISMAPLQTFLNAKGYNAHAWNGGINWGPSEERMEHIKTRLKEVYEENGQQKVSLVGWSLGGIYARELAREFPEMVRDVISLGSPFEAVNHPESTVVGKLFSYINPDVEPAMSFDPSLPIEPPMTSIYTQEDGVAHWQACLLKENKKTENIEVKSSHIGLIVCPQVLTVLLDRLAQPEGKWKKFDSKNYVLSRIKLPKKQAHRKKP